MPTRWRTAAKEEGSADNDHDAHVDEAGVGAHRVGEEEAGVGHQRTGVAAGTDHAAHDAESGARDRGDDAEGEALGHLHGDRKEEHDEDDEAEGALVGDAQVAVAERGGRLREDDGGEAVVLRVEAGRAVCVGNLNLKAAARVNALGDVTFASSARAVHAPPRRSRGSRVLVCAGVADCIGEVHANGRAFMLVSWYDKPNGTIDAMIYCTYYRTPIYADPNTSPWKRAV